MTVKAHRADRMIERYENIAAQLREAPFPRLRVVQVNDDGEKYAALRCPRCGYIVDDGSLKAVDSSTRWNSIVELDESDFDHRRVWFTQGDADYDSTLYYFHDSDGDQHAVRLPSGWSESWT